MRKRCQKLRVPGLENCKSECLSYPGAQWRSAQWHLYDACRWASRSRGPGHAQAPPCSPPLVRLLSFTVRSQASPDRAPHPPHQRASVALQHAPTSQVPVKAFVFTLPRLCVVCLLIGHEFLKESLLTDWGSGGWVWERLRVPHSCCGCSVSPS